jgi:hypothetical protein
LENNNLTTKVINPHPGEKVSVYIMEKSTIENTDKTEK